MPLLVDINNPTDRFKYGYDRNSNRLYRENLVQANFSEAYQTPTRAYDLLNPFFISPCAKAG
jgi:hypothetical protein